ncbi:hypothetical protein, partial [Vibrio campbellii]
TESLSKDDFCKIHNEYRKSADTALVNLMNYYCYSINLLSLPEIENRVKCIPSIVKRDSKLLLKVIKNLAPALLNIPVYSHGKNFRLCSKSLTIQAPKSRSFKKNLRDSLAKLGLRNIKFNYFKNLKKNRKEKNDLNNRIKSSL